MTLPIYARFLSLFVILSTQTSVSSFPTILENAPHQHFKYLDTPRTTKVSSYLFLFLFLGSFLNSCGCSTATSKTPPQEIFFTHLTVQSMGPNHPLILVQHMVPSIFGTMCCIILPNTYNYTSLTSPLEGV